MSTACTYHDACEHEWFRVQGPLQEWISSCAWRFQDTLLLRTIRMRSWCNWSVSSVAVIINQNKNKVHTRLPRKKLRCRTHEPTATLVNTCICSADADPWALHLLLCLALWNLHVLCYPAHFLEVQKAGEWQKPALWGTLLPRIHVAVCKCKP